MQQYINDMPQAVTSTLLFYADDLCILYQHKDVMQIEKRYSEDFENLNCTKNKVFH